MSDRQLARGQSAGGAGGARDEIRQIFALMPFWTAFAWEDIKTTYRRTVFGVAWITVVFLVMIGVKFIIFGGTSVSNGENGNFVAYLTVGFLIWTFISNVLSSSNCLLQFENWIKNDTIPIAGFPIIVLLRCLFNFVFTLIACLIILALDRVTLSPAIWSVTPALLLIFVMSYFTILLFAIIGLRYRDFTQIITAYVRAAIFLTPIFWYPENMGEMMKYLWWNPVSHFLWIVRDPIVDGTIPVMSWIYCSVLTVLISFMAIVTYKLTRRHLIFWF